MKKLALAALLLGCNAEPPSRTVLARTSNALYAAESKLPATPTSGDCLGAAVAISVDTAVVGAFNATGAVVGSGAAFVYVRGADGVWTEQQKLAPTDGLAGDNFGVSVAIDGQTLAIGARAEDTGATDAGSVYVFVRSGTTWTQQAKLSPSTNTAHCGESVALAGDTLLIGCPKDYLGLFPGGAAYVYVRAGTAWSQQARLSSDVADTNDRFGASVALFADSALVGAPNASDGVVYSFVRSGTIWNERDFIEPPSSMSGARFGTSLALAADLAVIGAPLDPTGGMQRGSAHVYAVSGGALAPRGKLTPTNAAAFDRFGQSVAIAGTTVIVSSSLGDGRATDSGAAYVFQGSGPVWSQVVEVRASDGMANDLFGGSDSASTFPQSGAVSLSGDTAVIGAMRKSNAAGSDAGGAVYAFRIVESKVTGAACAGSLGECTSGFCVDGVCCDRACGGFCEACTSTLKGSGMDGTCAVVAVATNPRGKCVKDAAYPTSCLAPGVCDGVGAGCPNFAGASVACGTTACVDGQVTGSTCNGAGTCVTVPKSCGAYRCKDATTCATSCATDADCARSTDACVAGVCVSRRANGEAATVATDCLSGFVADGVCCNSACTGTCEACDLASTKGTCTPVAGDAKHGACPTGSATDPCAAASCNGITRDSCSAFVIGKVCATPTCAAGKETFEARCVGNGLCPTPRARSCEPYVCGEGSCKLACAEDGDCIAGYACDKVKSRCVVRAVCDSDHTLKAPNGVISECAPYLCADGACREACDGSDDCTLGRVCDAHKCIAPAAVENTADEGGCAMGRGSPRFALLLLALAAFATRRRRSWLSAAAS